MSKRRRIEVSDHAVLRFLERAARFDIDALKASIAGCAAVGRDLGSRIVVVQGVKLILSSDCSRVVTVLHRDQEHHEWVAPIEVDAHIDVTRRPKRRRRR